MTLETERAATPLPKPPATRRDEVRETLHGVDILDPYRWLEDQESPETRAWVEAQDAHTKALLHAYPGRARLERRLTELLRVDSIGVPFERNGWYFLTRRKAEQEQSVIYRRHGLEGEDEVLINSNTLSADKMTSASLLDVSQDGRVLAYGLRQGGEDEIEVRLREVAAGRDLPDRLPRGRYYGMDLKPDLSGFYYSYNTPAASRIRYHAMGTGANQDVEVFGEGYGPDKILGASLSEDGRWLLVTVHYGSAAQQTELWVQDVAAQGPFTPIVHDIPAHFDAQIVDDTLYILTDWDAPNGRLLKTSVRRPERENWTEIVPTRETAAIEYFSLAGGKLFVNYLENVSSRIRIFDAEGRPEGDLALPGVGSAGGPFGRWERSEAFYGFTSFVTPYQIHRVDIATGEQTLWAQQNIPVDTGQFEAKQVWVTSKDGTQVPMFLVHKKGLAFDGTNPTLLTGYGGFSASLTPAYSSTAALWAENGGVYAVVNLRGGGEFGEEWHRAGMQAKKQNVFDDFIGAAEWLIATGVTSASKLAISGGSNGGLLVGAALTQRPDLFRAVVCAVPLLDMVRYHKFLVAAYWVPEYGSADDPEQFRTLHAYSPYHHVKSGEKYPAVLLVTGNSDTRVAPLHARKMAALLQHETGSAHPILLHYDTRAGHSGGQPLRKTIEDQADVLSFLFWQLGVE